MMMKMMALLMHDTAMQNGFKLEIFVQALETAAIQLHSKTSGGVSCKAHWKDAAQAVVRSQ